MSSLRFAAPAITSAVLFWAAVVAADSDGGSRAEWVVRDGTVSWSVAVESDPVPSESSHALIGPPWFPSAPQLVFEILEGGERPLDGFAGKLLILNFWAIWCEACAIELPWLQRLYLAERDRGLEVLTVNVNDPDDAARQFAWALNLVLPIARYTDSIDQAFEVRGLPTMIVIDRGQRIRARWTGHRPEDEEKITETVRALLAEPADLPGEELARVLSGQGRLAVRWSRRFPAEVQGLAALPRSAGAMATIGRELVLLAPDGTTTERMRAPIGTGLLRSNPYEASGSTVGIGFRRGAVRVVPLVDPPEESVGWEAPAPVLDLEFGPIRGATPPELLLATTEGLFRVGLDGTLVDRREELGSLRAVAVTGAGDVVVLDSAGRATWLDTALRSLESLESAPPAAGLVSAAGDGPADGIGVVPPVVRAAAAGRLLDGESGQIALALEDHLLLLDAATGSELLRARWPEIGALAAGDLDGDGRDELFVGSGKRITVLEAAGSGEGGDGRHDPVPRSP